MASFENDPWLGLLLVHGGVPCGNPEKVCDGVYAWADGTHVDVNAYEGDEGLAFTSTGVATEDCGVLGVDGVVRDKGCHDPGPYLCQWRCENIRKGVS